MEIFGLVFFVIAATALLGWSIYLLCNNNDLGGLLLAFAVIALGLTLSFGTLGVYERGRINGLVESGKYEIVTNEDYSMKELQEFKKVGDYYLKEIE